MKKDKTHPLRPIKRLGQHFLIDKNIARKIVRAAELRAGDVVLEIGPGRGVLTEPLIEAGCRVVAVEVDPRLSSEIRKRFTGVERLTVIEEDALKISYTELAKKLGKRLKVVANLPYNISGPILGKFIDKRGAFELLVLMFQKEVALRITARPGTKDYGILSVLCQTFFDVSLEFHVAPKLFRPVPKVESAVVKLRVLGVPKVEVPDEGFYKKVVKSAFGRRRKTLLNSLCTLGMDRERLMMALESAGIDPKRRGESLDLAEFSALTKALHRLL